jgi:hypothetical protein
MQWSTSVTERVVRGERGPTANARTDLRVAARPLQLVWPTRERPFDVGIGYLVQFAESNHEALFVTLSPPPLRLESSSYSDSSGSGVITWDLDVAIRGSRDWEWGQSGFGGALQLSSGYDIFTRGRNTCGMWRGEIGTGVFAEGGFAQIEGTRIWSSTIGLWARLPGAVYASMENQRC